MAAVAIAGGQQLTRLGLRDSKQLSAKRRDAWYRWLQKAQQRGELNFAVSLVGEKIIDQRGIVYAINLGLRRVLRRLNLRPARCLIQLDGGLRAPAGFKNQQTIIRGDQSVPIIMLASIAAKVRRDRRLIRLARRYPGYGFEVHKGYGTAAHYQALHRLGLSPIHRRSFCQALLKSANVERGKN